MKIALIGTGGMARSHLRALSREPDLQIVGHASPTPGHAEAAAARWGGRAFQDHRALLDETAPEAVWISVPPGAHGAIERDLIARRIPFFVEKPLAADRETAETIAALLDESGLIAGVGYHWRAMDTLGEVQETLAQNPAHMVLGAWHDATPPPAWWRRQESSGGQMVEQATHLFDLARYLVGEAAVEATKATWPERPAYPDMNVASVSAALLRYENGATGVFTATCLLNGQADVHVKLACEGLMITITQAGVVYDRGRERREVRRSNDPVQAENRAFLEALRRNDPTLLYSSYADARLTHQLCTTVAHASILRPPPTRSADC